MMLKLLKKRPETLKAFKEDLKWMIKSLEEDSPRLTSVNMVKPMTSDPITTLAEDSVTPVSIPTSIEFTSASLITDSSQQTAVTTLTTTLAIDSTQLTSSMPMTSDPITALEENSVTPVSIPTSIEFTSAALITDSSQQTAVTTLTTALAIDSTRLTSSMPMTSDHITALEEDSVTPVSSPTSKVFTSASLITDSSQQSAVTTLAIDSTQLTSLTHRTSDPITTLADDSVKPVSSPTSTEITNASLETDSSQQTAITTLALDSAHLTSLTPMTSDPITTLAKHSVKPVSSPPSIELFTSASLVTDSSQQIAVTTQALDSAQLTSLTRRTSDPITTLADDSVKPVSSPTSIEFTSASLLTDSSQPTAVTTLAKDSAQLTSLTPMTSDPTTTLADDSVKPVSSHSSIEFTTDLLPMDIIENLNDYEVFSDDLDEELSNLESNEDNDESSYLVSDSDITDSDSASIIYHLPGLSSKTHCIPESDVDMRDENTENEVDLRDKNTENEENILSDKDTESDKGETASDDNSLSESEKLRSTDKPSIFVRKVLKSAVKKTKQKKKGLRVYNSYHACFYCGLVVQHVGPHLKKKHDIEDLENLRQKGDHKHNLKVVEKGKGELLLSRRPKKAFRSDDYGPCPICLDWLLKSTLQRHQKSCIGVKGDEEKNSKRTLIMKSDIISGRFYTQSEGSKQLREEVFSKMKNDNVSKVAQNDYLIVQLAESCLKRSLDNKLKRANYASERMRLSAKMLLELRSLENTENKSSESKDKSRSLDNSENESSESKEKSMWEFLTPTSFDNLAQAAINVSLPQMDDTEDLKSPSNAIKLKYDLIRLINIKWASILKSTDHENDEQQKGCKALKNLLHLFRVQWGEKVTKLARTVLIQRSFQKVTDIPSPEDIKRLNDHVKQELKMLKDDVDDSSPEYFKKAVTLVQTRLLLFNKRRSGEIDAISLKDYANMRTQLSDVDKSLVGELSSLEKHLLDTQDLMVVRGKRCRPVPVIIPEDVKEPLKKIADYRIRKKSLIKSSNKHLFASSGDGPVRCYDSLKVVSDGLSLANPERITSVSLRKYTATLSQVLNLEDGELTWLCRHLGHTKRVHLNSYRQMSGFLERVEISKLMLIHDNNLTGKFKGKKLEEINMEDILQEDAGKDRLQTDFDENEQNNNGDQHEDNEEIFSFAEEKIDDDDDDDSCTSSPRKKIRKPNRVKWTPQEEEELHKYFAEHFKTKTVPGKKSCLKAIEKSKKNNGQIHRRKYPTIVKKISNMNKKCA